MEQINIGIIGGSGFYQMKNLENKSYITIATPFGSPSEKILTGDITGNRVAFIARHGIGHRFNPSEVNYRANLYALKLLSVKYLISLTAVGSLIENLKPTDLVIPDQFFDNTFKREKTYFEKGIVAHVSMAKPVCPVLSQLALTIGQDMGLNVHPGGTYFNMEGPQFSSKAESNTYRKLGFSVIGMTQAIEAKLAKELEMCFLPLAFVTDFDCWHPEAETVSVKMVIDNLNKNTVNSQLLIENLCQKIKTTSTSCNCQHSLNNAIISTPETIPAETYKNLKPVIEKYIKKN